MSNIPTQHIASLKGYVTTYRSVAGKSASELEQALGLAPSSLSAGYHVYQLYEPVSIGDFEWKDRTTYSDGWHYDRSINEYVQRRDELRATLGKANAWSEAAVDLKLRTFMEFQAKRLNVRAGPDRIVKIVPTLSGIAFPDSPFRNVPQWKLTVCKRFILVP